MSLPKQRLTDSRIQGILAPEKGQDEYPDDLVVGLRLRIDSSSKKVWILRAKVGGKTANRRL